MESFFHFGISAIMESFHALLHFGLVATQKLCCNMSYLVAIAVIATKLFRQPLAAKGRAAIA
jgi:hypothetical protein